MVEKHSYGSIFFNFVDIGSSRSAKLFLPPVANELRPYSVLDVGCGRGAWLAEWKELGAAETIGLDGDYVDKTKLLMPPEGFKVIDLVCRFDLGRKFDLVESLEVAEHLPDGAADGFIASLTRHGDVILFSAASPGQGGEFHINERPGSYWMKIFKRCGFTAFDFPRQAVRGIKGIEPWYRYNSMLFANDEGRRRLSASVLATEFETDRWSEYAPCPWRLRCAALRILPRPCINVLARLKHAIFTTTFDTAQTI